VEESWIDTGRRPRWRRCARILTGYVVLMGMAPVDRRGMIRQLITTDGASRSSESRELNLELDDVSSHDAPSVCAHHVFRRWM